MWDHVVLYLNGERVAIRGDDAFATLVEFPGVLDEMGRRPIKVDSGLLREECAALLRRWREAGLCQAY